MANKSEHCQMNSSRGIVVKLHRSEKDSNAYTVVGSTVAEEENAIVAEANEADEVDHPDITDKQDTHFLRANDRATLSDYMFLLVAQFKRGAVSQKDLGNARRRNSSIRIGYSGLKCKHCGGSERGSYFPTAQKNLQACPSMFHKHLISCNHCPNEIKKSLEVSKLHHRAQNTEKKAGTQVGFFTTFWKRIRQDLKDDEETKEGKAIVFTFIRDLIEKYSAESESLSKKHIEENHRATPSSTLREANDSFSSLPSNFIDKVCYQGNIQDCAAGNSPSSSIASFATSGSLDPLKILDEVIDQVLMNEIIMWNNPGVVKELDWDKQSISRLQGLVDSDLDMMEMIDLLLEL